jgi:hypothetical protein
MGSSEVVVKTQYGEMVQGQFQPTEETRIQHEDCGEDED